MARSMSWVSDHNLPPMAPYGSTMAPLTTLSSDTITNWCRMVIVSFYFARGVKEMENASKNTIENKIKYLSMLTASNNTVRN